ncbi:alpha/beta hydrolase [Chitinimonas lacunae]|uniref:Alpha/beta hydrolase n=1 Tax=Chitinimonas lacunae TaxID=1963018 RepID=A0ABV8MV68_9NEIS
MTDLSLELVCAHPDLPGSHPPLLFLHGAYAAAWCWQPYFLPYFAAQGYSAWALSLRGHGRSDGHGTLASWGIDDYVDDLAWAVGQIEAHHGRPPILIAHSMGAFVALRLARQRLLPGLALLAPVPPAGLLGSTLSLLWRDPLLLWELNLVQHGRQVPQLSSLRRLLFSPDMPETELAGYARRFQRESDRALLEMSLPQFDLRPPLGSPPLLVLGSRDDHLMPAMLVEAAAMSLGQPVQLVDGLGHVLMLDTRWRLVADSLRQWLEQGK